MTIQTIDPLGLNAVEWMDMNTLYLTKFGTIPRANSESEWQPWAANLLNLPSIHGTFIPSPYEYSDWRRWAAEFNLAMQSVNL